MVNKKSKAAHEPIPLRLRALRKVEEYETAKEFALAMGITANRYGNVEAGSPLGIELALMICKLCPDVSMDWLYTGNVRFLTVEYRRKIVRAEYELSRQTPLSRTAKSGGRSSNAFGVARPAKRPA